MTQEKPPLRGNPKPLSREDRLKRALKENLSRRKSQSRARARAPGESFCEAGDGFCEAGDGVISEENSVTKSKD